LKINIRDILKAKAVGYSLNNSAINVLLPDLKQNFQLKFSSTVVFYPLGPDITTARGFSVVTGGIFDSICILILKKGRTNMKVMCSSADNKCNDRNSEEKKTEKKSSEHAHTHEKRYADVHFDKSKRRKKRLVYQKKFFI